MSATEESLSSILSNAEAPAPEEVKAETTDATGEKPAEKAANTAPPAEKLVEKPAEKETPSRGDDGKFKAAEKVDEKPVDKPRADVAAIIDERRKRQAAERALAELQGQKPAAKPSVFENEDAAISSRVDEGTRGLRETLFKQSVKIARLVHGESYASAEEAFALACENDSRLVEGLRSADDPGEYIHSMGLHIKELADVNGDILKYREKVTAESSSKLAEQAKQIASLTEQVAALKKAQEDIETLPRSLNNRASGASPKAGDEDDEPIQSITRFGNKQR